MIAQSPSEDKENQQYFSDRPNSPNLRNKKQMTDRHKQNNEIIDVDADYDMQDDAQVIDLGIEEEDEDSEDVVAIEDPEAKNNSIPHANDFANLSKKLMKPVPDYPVKDEARNVWEIKDWSGLNEEKVKGPKFTCGGFEWNILLFPKGNGNNSISIYMEPHPIGDNVADDWYVCAQFALDIWNPHHPEVHVASGSSHRFNKNETDWGFSAFIDSRQMKSVQKDNQFPLLEHNQINITGYVKVIDDSSTGVLWHSFMDYDSKKNTSYVGLSNQGATCYLNSLLQSYFTTKLFRKLVYQIPTKTGQNQAVPLALQRIFYSLSTSTDAAGTLELTKSFGWDSSDAFTQHDVQELNRILMDKLETAMKGTKIENKLNDIFVGKMKSYIKCVNVPYESSRTEDFWDIQLNVKGFKTLQQAFENYIEIEMLEGENKYQAGDEYGYQDAKKGVVFQSFPPVLHLQLKRFEYDFMVDDLVKIDDLYEFPDKIDLKPYLDEDIPELAKKENWTYKLHGVLVHQGSISNGHYYAMIKPSANDESWLRFDDDKVWKVTKTQVFQENFGANELSTAALSKMSRVEQNEYLIRRSTSAYMLVYYKESELLNILPDDDSDIDASVPAHIPQQIKEEKEQLEKLERYRQEALYYTNVKIATVSNFNKFNGFDIFPDPTLAKFYDEKIFDQRAYPTQLKVKKESKLGDLYKLVAKELGYISSSEEIEIVDEEKEIIDGEDDAEVDLSVYPFRLVMVNHRNNHTNRADTPVPRPLKNATISQIYAKCFNKKYDEMVFYVEELNKDLHSVNEINSDKIEEISPETFDFDRLYHKVNDTQLPITKTSVPFSFKNIGEGGSHYQIFLKYFDINALEVRGLTHVTVNKDDTIESLKKPINKLLGFNEDTPLEIYEELSQTKIEDVDTSLTFEKNELSNGDILVIQVATVENATIGKKITNIKEYYKFILTRLHIEVKPFKGDEDEEDSDFVADEESEAGDGESPQEAKQIELAKERSKSFDLWITTQHSYQELAKELAAKIGDAKPEFLRIFIVNNQNIRYPLKSHQSLSQIFPKLISVSSVTRFEYEILNVTLKEYENMKSVKVYWLNSVLKYQLFDLLLPKSSTAGDLIEKLVHKLNIPEKNLNNILLWAGYDHKYVDMIKFDRTIDSIDHSFELYAGYFPADVEILSQHGLVKRYVDKPTNPEDIEDEVVRKDFVFAKQFSKSLNIIPVFQFHKNTNYQHGIPFVFPVYPDESIEDTKERLRHKLGLGQQAFEKVKLALVDSHGNGRYIDQETQDVALFDQVAQFEANVSLAVDHPDRTPRRANPFDKGISIK